MTVNFTPRLIIGRWTKGYALDWQTTSSQFIGYDEFGHPRFETTRSEVGELLYRLKYRREREMVAPILEAAMKHVLDWRPPVDVLVPVPPSTRREFQPVHSLAKALGERLGIPVADCVSRSREIPTLKDITDLDERLKLLEGLHTVDEAAVRGRSVLLFDDLYRSGATMNSITAELYEVGKATNVFAFTITKTRSNQ
jgi:competence protein ComFC